jgi:hypothetical protein
MAQIPQISMVSSMHGTTARATELAIIIKTITIKALIKAITPKTITKR